MNLTWTELDSGAGAQAIERAWTRLREPHAGPGEPPARALSLNLIVRTHDSADAERLAGCLWKLGPRHPARIFFVFAGAHDRLRLAADARGSELLLAGGAPERTISLVSALLQADLPVLLLWRGARPAGGSEFDRWAAHADRILLDAQRLGVSASELEALGRDRRRKQQVTDFTWARLTPWRQLLCQGLESLPGAELAIEQLVFHASGEATENLAALLLAGWLAGQLDWRTPEAQPGTALRLHRGGRPILVSWEATPGHPGRLQGLDVVARGAARDGRPEEVKIALRQHGRHLSLRVHHGADLVGHWSGVADVEMRGESDILCEELSLTGPDPLYELSLHRGLELIERLRSAAA